MKTLLKILRAIAIFLLCDLLLVAILFTVVNYSVRNTVLNAHFIKGQLSEPRYEYGGQANQNVYDVAAISMEQTLEDAVVQAFESEAANASGVGGWGIDADVFTEVIREVLREADISGWLQTQAEGMLEKETNGEKQGLYPYVKSEADALVMVLDVAALKDPLKTSLHSRLMDVLEAELEKYRQQLPVEIQALLNLAQSTGVSERQYAEMAIDAALGEVDNQIPDEINISPSKAELQDQGVQDLRQGITQFNNAFPKLCLLVILITLLIVLILLVPFNQFGKRIRRILGTLGLVLLVAGIICIVLALICVNVLAPNIPVEDMVDNLTSGVNDLGDGGLPVNSLTEAINTVVSEQTVDAFFKALFSPVRTAGIILAVVGLAMLIGWFVMLVTKGDKGEEELPPEDVPAETLPAGMPPLSQPSEGAAEADEEMELTTVALRSAPMTERLSEPPPEADEEGEAELAEEAAGVEEPDDTFSRLTDESPDDSEGPRKKKSG